MNSQNQKNTVQMNLTVRLKSLPSEAVYLGVPQMSGCPRMNAFLQVSLAGQVAFHRPHTLAMPSWPNPSCS
jgi:hypothetical protein